MRILWEFPRGRAALFRISLEEVRISRNSFKSGQDWSEFLKEMSGLVRIPLEVVTIGQNFFRNGQDWSEFLSKCLGFVRIPLGASRINHNTFESSWFSNPIEHFKRKMCWSTFCSGMDCSKALQEQVQLFRIILGGGWIAQMFRMNREDWSEFLWERMGLVEFLWEQALL